MLLNFVIADDEKASLDCINNYISKFIADNSIDGNISLCTSLPREVMDYASKKSDQMNVYILDINFESDMNGLTLGRVIRDRDPNAYIIFLTAYIQFSMMVFKYRLKVFDFLIKPVSYSDFADCMNALLRDYSKILDHHFQDESNFISVKSGYQEYRIPVNDIIFIESFGPKLLIHTDKGKVEYYGALKDVEKTINEMTDIFYRSHKSFLINTRHIEKINLREQTVIMSTGHKCLVSRDKKAFVKNLMSTQMK